MIGYQTTVGSSGSASLSTQEPNGCRRKMSNNVDHPAHYNQGEIECIDDVKADLTPEEFRGFLKGSILKYMWRESHKRQDEDLKKAEWYLDYLIWKVDHISKNKD